jgi:hypothetical protein
MFARTRLPVSRLFMPGGGRLPVRMSTQSAVINFAWDANAAGDNVTDYKVYWGASTGSYTASQSVGTATTYSINHPGVTRYYAVTATNVTGESAFSNELIR